MQTKIVESIAAGALGMAPRKKLFRVPSGQYAGRMAAVFKTSDNEIKYTYADNPYSSWSTPVSILTDSAFAPLDVVMDDDGNIVIIYCEETTNYVCSMKLVFSGGSWVAQPKVYIYNSGSCNVPSITIDLNGNYWAAFSVINVSVLDIHVKSSTDSGAVWGSGPTDGGDVISSGLVSAIPKIITSDNDAMVVYAADLNEMRFRKKSLGGGSWTTEFVISSATNIDENFDAAVLPEGFLGVAYDADNLYYREFDGLNWGSALLLDANGASYPQIEIINNFPVILYLSVSDSNQILTKYIHRQTGSFSTPLELETRQTKFEQATIFDKTSETYSDLTTAAGSNTSGDLYHPSSLVLMSNVEDKIYLGSDEKFRFLRLLLSTPGIGGTVSFSYYDGVNWRSFTPSGGAYNLDTADKELILWEDFDSVPGNWQKNEVDNNPMYWIKIEVSSSFTTPPVGTQITSISNIVGLTVRR